MGRRIGLHALILLCLSRGGPALAVPVLDDPENEAREAMDAPLVQVQAEQEQDAVVPARQVPPTSTPVLPPVPAPVIEVTVRGMAPVPEQSGSDFNLKLGQLSDVPRRSAESLLSLAPGLLLTNPGGQYHASQIFLRGFDAGEGQDIEFTIDGVPINEVSNPHSHGYADTHFIIPQFVSNLRIIEGPFDPRQGDFAVAGSARYDLGFDRRGIIAEGGYGAFGRRRLTLLWGPSSHGPGTFAGADFEAGNGFGPNRAFAAARAMARHEMELSPQTRVAILFTSYATRFDAAGVIRLDDYQARRLPCGPGRDEQFFCFHDANQGGAGSRHSVAVTGTHKEANGVATATTFVTLRSLRLRQNFTGFVTDLNSDNLPQRGDGTEQGYQAMTVGSRGSYRFVPARRGILQEAEVGYFARHDDGLSLVRRLRTVGGVPYRVDADDRLNITNVATYAALRLQPWRRLVLTGGLRVDGFLFAVTDQNLPAGDRTGSRLTSETTEAYGAAVQPKLGAQVDLGAGLRWILATGIGTRSSYAQALSAGEFAPFARVRAAETGMVLKRILGDATSFDGRLIGFYTHLDRDLLFDEQAGRNVLIGASNRFGTMASARASHPSGWDVLASMTYAEAYLPPPEQQGFGLTAGQRMPYVPRWVGRVDGSWRHPFTVRERIVQTSVASGFTYVAPRPLPFEQTSPALITLDIAGRIGTGPVQLGLEVTNLLDRRNREAVFNYASNFRGADEPPSLLPQQHFSAGAPRAYFVTLSIAHSP